MSFRLILLANKTQCFNMYVNMRIFITYFNVFYHMFLSYLLSELRYTLTAYALLWYFSPDIPRNLFDELFCFSGAWLSDFSFHVPPPSLSLSLCPFLLFSFLTFHPDSPRYIALILVWNGIIDYRRNIARTYQLTMCRRNRRTSHGLRQADPNELFVSSFAVIFIHRGTNEPALPFLSSFYSFMSQSDIA